MASKQRRGQGYREPMGFPGSSNGKEPACQCRRQKRCRFNPWVGRSLEEGMATHSSVLAWRNPWTEEPGGLGSTGSHRVGHVWSDWTLSQKYQFLLPLQSQLERNPAQFVRFSEYWAEIILVPTMPSLDLPSVDLEKCCPREILYKPQMQVL